MPSLGSRLVSLEAEAARRRLAAFAALMSELDSIPLAEAQQCAALVADDLEAVERAFPGPAIEVGDVARFLARRHGMTEEEMADAACEAQRYLAQLGER